MTFNNYSGFQMPHAIINEVNHLNTYILIHFADLLRAHLSHSYRHRMVFTFRHHSNREVGRHIIHFRLL